MRSIITDSIATTILLLDDTDNSDPARQALAAVDEDPQVTALSVYAIGDGAAMVGLLLAGCRTIGEVTILVSLLE